MSDKKAVLVIFGYSNGSYDHAVGDHAVEVMQWLNAGQSMMASHGGGYKGKKMIVVPAPSDDLEPVSNIAERTFPEWVEELRGRK